MSRYSQYTEEEIDAMCHEADRKSKEEINLQIALLSMMVGLRSFIRNNWMNLKHSKYYYDFDRNR